MPDVPGTGAEGLFTKFGKDDPAAPVPTAEQQFLALEARGGALLLGMLSRLQAVEGILRTERVARLSAEETIRTIVIDNDAATDEINRLQSLITDVNFRITELLEFSTQFISSSEDFIFGSQQSIFDFQQTVPLPNPILASWQSSLNVINAALVEFKNASQTV